MTRFIPGYTFETSRWVKSTYTRVLLVCFYIRHSLRFLLPLRSCLCDMGWDGGCYVRVFWGVVIVRYFLVECMEDAGRVLFHSEVVPAVDF